jgi:hypothetical protein
LRREKSGKRDPGAKGALIGTQRFTSIRKMPALRKFGRVVVIDRDYSRLLVEEKLIKTGTP